MRESEYKKERERVRRKEEESNGGRHGETCTEILGDRDHEKKKDR